VDWTILAPDPAPDAMEDACVAPSGRLFAVGGGTVLTSTDGRAWSRIEAPAGGYHSVAATASGIVVAGEGGALLTSTDDGAAWATASTGSAAIHSVAASGQVVIGVTEAGLVALRDGGHPRSIPVPREAGLARKVVALAENRWLVLADRGLYVVADGGWWMLAVAAPEDTRLIALSVDGDTVWLLGEGDTAWWARTRLHDLGGGWPIEASGTLDTRLFGPTTIAARGDHAVFGGAGAETWATSDLGGTWDRSWSIADIEPGHAGTIRALLATPDGWIGVGDGLVHSADGATWAAEGDPRSRLWAGALAADGSLVVATDYAAMIGDPATSRWARSGPVERSLAGGDVVSMARCCYSAAATATADLVAGDGVIWRSDPSATRWRAAFDDDPYWRRFYAMAAIGQVVVAGGAGLARSTDDGRTWAMVDRGGDGMDPPTVMGIGVTSEGFAAADNRGVVRISTDGRRWQALPVAPGALRDIADADGSAGVGLVAVGDHGLIARFDGTAWAAAPAPTDATLTAIWHDDASGELVAVGERGVTLASADGVAWRALASPVSGVLTDVFGDGRGRFVAVGDGGVVLERRLDHSQSPHIP
jgi:photosystem II stability/assembly factor-like uncharacterized protein